MNLTGIVGDSTSERLRQLKDKPTLLRLKNAPFTC